MTDHYLILDDDSKRIDNFHLHLPHAHWARTADQCIHALQTLDYKGLFLDHDLEMSGAGHGNGMDVVRWLCQHHTQLDFIVIHSLNLDAVPHMYTSLRSYSYNVTRHREAWTSVSNLANLAQGKFTFEEKWTDPLSWED